MLLKARAIKSKLEDGVKKKDRDEIVAEIRAVLSYTAQPAHANPRDSSSAGTHQSYGSLRMPSRGMQLRGADILGEVEMSVGADFDMEASLRLGQELAPIELWVKDPQPIYALQGLGLQQVVCGASHTVCLSNDGNVQAWGWLPEVGVNLTPTPVIGFGERVTRIACGLYHTVLLTESARVFTYGLNDYGQLGQDMCDRLDAPESVPSLEGNPHLALYPNTKPISHFVSKGSTSDGSPVVSSIRRPSTQRAVASPGVWVPTDSSGMETSLHQLTQELFPTSLRWMK